MASQSIHYEKQIGVFVRNELGGSIQRINFKVVDQNSDKNIGTIVISQMELDKDARKKNAVLRRKQYQ